MKMRQFVFLIILILLLANHLLSAEFDGWFHGTSGYNSAYKLAFQKNEPMIVYFHTDWCGWCKKLNTQYLEINSVKTFLNNIVKAEINPDISSADKATSNSYSVKGYPTFLVVMPNINEPPISVYPFLKSGQLTPAAFVEQIKQAIAQFYNRHAYQL
ncbi:thioredoxin family protein, partial [candidate division KSB1 bacterium]|nr:thioredoxin family protein [candidate division KSB1 bacterium]